MTVLKDLRPDIQQRVLWLHHKAFSNSACGECKGACCEHCAGALGYLYPWSSTDGPDKAAFAVIAEKYGFDKRLGFKGETGCKLPVQERSSVCLSFICGGVSRAHARSWPSPGVNKPFTAEQMESAHEIRDLMYRTDSRKEAETV